MHETAHLSAAAAAAAAAADWVSSSGGGSASSLMGEHENHDSINTEHLALIGFAARLGTSVVNDYSDIIADVREDAELLMSFMSSKPSRSQSQSSLLSDDGDSSKPRSGGARRRSLPVSDSSESYEYQSDTQEVFSFTCPSLSLYNPSAFAMADSISHHGSYEAISRRSTAPPYLLSRPIEVDNKYAIGEVAESLANNVMNSFELALGWRTKSWVDALARTLNLNSKEDPAEQEAYIQELLKCKEGRVIVSLLRASSETRICDVQTSIRVMPQRIYSDDDDDDHSNDMSDQQQPSAKKRRTVSEEEHVNPSNTETSYYYRIGYAVHFQAIITIAASSLDETLVVTLGAPGRINGTFKSAAPGDEELTGVAIELDTEYLAKAMEYNSRYIVRTVAASCIPCVPPGDAAPITKQEQEQETTVHTPSMINRTDSSIITPRRESSFHQQDSCYENNEDDSVFVGTKAELLPLRRVSPSPMSPNPYISQQNLLLSPGKTSSVSKIPMLVSPSPSRREYLEFGQLPKSRSPVQSWPEAQGYTRPSLPTLVEVACSVMEEKSN